MHEQEAHSVTITESQQWLKMCVQGCVASHSLIVLPSPDRDTFSWTRASWSMASAVLTWVHMPSGCILCGCQLQKITKDTCLLYCWLFLPKYMYVPVDTKGRHSLTMLLSLIGITWNIVLSNLTLLCLNAARDNTNVIWITVCFKTKQRPAAFFFNDFCVLTLPSRSRKENCMAALTLVSLSWPLRRKPSASILMLRKTSITWR